LQSILFVQKSNQGEPSNLANREFQTFHDSLLWKQLLFYVRLK